MTEAAAPGLTVTGVSVAYAGEAVVEDVSLAVAGGQVCALLGPSGCGKSTLLRAVAGLEPIRSGSVAWQGDDLAGVPTHKRGFGLVFQDGQLFGGRSVAGNIEYGLKVAGVGRAERAARVAELLDLVGLAGYERRDVTTLSGGEAGRVALARALAPRPRLLLLDEPLAALDRELRERLARDIRSILVAAATPAIYVTHDQEEALTVADTLAAMSAGRLLITGPAWDVWRSPGSLTAARLLGYRFATRAEVAGGVARSGWGSLPTSLPDGAAWVVARPGAFVADASGDLRVLSAGPPYLTGAGPAVSGSLAGVEVEILVDPSGEARSARAIPDRMAAVSG